MIHIMKGATTTTTTTHRYISDFYRSGGNKINSNVTQFTSNAIEIYLFGEQTQIEFTEYSYI